LKNRTIFIAEHAFARLSFERNKLICSNKKARMKLNEAEGFADILFLLESRHLSEWAPANPVELVQG
jgi:hypothetical protein